MTAATLILVVGIIVLTALAIRFLVGAMRVAITVGLILLAIGLIMAITTEHDPLNVKPTAASVVETFEETVQGVNNTVNQAVEGVELPKLPEFASTDQE